MKIYYNNTNLKRIRIFVNFLIFRGMYTKLLQFLDYYRILQNNLILIWDHGRIITYRII